MTAAASTAEATDRAHARTELDADYTPRYIQAAHRVRARITDGTYARWSCIPGSSELATELGVSRSVMLHGLMVLVRAGYLRHVESKPHQVTWDAQQQDTPDGPRF